MVVNGLVRGSRRISTRHIVSFLILSFAFLYAHGLRAQWTQKQFPGHIGCVYFLDKQGATNTGFVGLTSGTVWQTTNNGASWKQVTTPPNIYPVTSFDFQHSKTGWCSVAVNGTSTSSIWKTTDGGSTWMPLTIIGQMAQVAYSPTTSYLFAIDWKGPIMQSTDLGATWTPLFPVGMNSIAFGGPNGIIAAHNSKKPYYFTTDGGFTWANAGSNIMESYAASSASNTLFVAIGETSSQATVSSDGGQKWISRGATPGAPTGCSMGTPDHIFMQTQSGGIYVTKDTGQTWISTCGPSNWPDTRFYAKGTEVFAADGGQSLWYSAAADTRPVGNFWFANLRFFANAVRCSYQDIIIPYGYIPGCSASLSSATISGATGAFQFVRKNTGLVPATDSLIIRYSPSSSLKDTARVLLHFVEGVRVVDTIVTIYGRGTTAMDFAVPSLLRQSALTTCDIHDTLLKIRNLSCDSLLLVSATLSDSADFALSGLPLPHWFKPGDSAMAILQYRERQSGQYTSRVTLHFSSPYTPDLDTTIQLDLNIVRDLVPKFSIPAITLASRCSTLDTTLTLSNPSCDTMYLASLTLVDSSIGRLTDSVLANSIGPYSSQKIHLHVNSAAKGDYTDTLHVRYRFGTHTMDTALALRVSVAANVLPSATLSLTNVSFGNVSMPCDEAERTIVITNKQCRDLTVRTAALDVQDTQFTVLEQTPTTLSTGESDTLRLRFRPDHVGGTAHQLRLTLEIDGILHDTIITVRGFGVSVFNDTVLTQRLSFDTVTRCSSAEREGSLVNLSCHSITVTSASMLGSAGFTIIGPTFPMTLSPHDTLHLRLLLSGTTAGPANDVARITIHDPGTNNDYFAEMSLSGLVIPSSYRLSLSTSSITVQNIPPCGGSADTELVLQYRSNCGSFRIDSAVCSGDAIVTLGGLRFPATLAGDTALHIPIHIVPQSASSGDAIIHLYGVGLDTTIRIHYTTGAPVRVLHVAQLDTAFSTRSCVPISHTLRVELQSCDSATIDAIRLNTTGTHFRLITTPSFPVRLGPAGALEVTIEYDPDGSGSNVADLEILASELGFDRSFALFGSSSGTHSAFRLDVTAADGTATLTEAANRSVQVQISARDAVPDSLQLRTLSCTLHYDGTLLTERAASAASGWAIDNAVEVTPGSLALRLHRNSTATVPPASAVATVSFHTTIGDSTVTPIVLAQPRLNEDDTTYERCVLSAVAPADPVRFLLQDTCGTALLRELLNGRPSVEITALEPNPVAAQDRALTLNLNASTEMDAECELVDVLGRSVLAVPLHLLAGEQRQTVPLAGTGSEVQSGSYFLVLHAGGATVTKRVAIDR